MKTTNIKYSLVFTLFLFLLMIFQIPAGDCEVKVTYLYHLSNFSGTVPYMMPQVRLDNVNREVYVIATDGVKIFNDSGMEIHDFSHSTQLSSSHDFAVDEEGNIYVLCASYNQFTREASYSFDRCNYKIEPIEKIELKGLPSDIADFVPYRVFYRNGLFYLGDPAALKIVVVDKQGQYKATYDLAVSIGATENKEDVSVSDFFIDRDGSILFTAPVLGRAYRVSPDGKVDTFGKRGSAPGRFGVPAGIVADSQGNYFVSDKLKSCIIVFDKDFNFVTEFGFRGPRPHNLVVPSSLTIDDRNRLYVSQLAKRGVSVFQITNN